MQTLYILLILYILYMSDKTTVAVSRKCLIELREMRFDLRVETLEQVIENLIEKYKSSMVN